MTRQQQLEILQINREQIQQNNAFAFDFLNEQNKVWSSSEDEELQLSLQLNNCLAQFYFHSNYRKSIEIAKSVLERYPNSTYYFYTATLNSFTGVCYTFLAEYDKAENYLNKALELARHVYSEKPLLIVSVLQSLFENNFYKKGDYEISAGYLKQALQILEQHPESLHKSGCLMQLGSLYFDKGEYQSSLEYFLKAMEGFENKFDLQNMAIAFSNVGMCYYRQGKLNDAETYLRKAHELCSKAATPDNAALCNYNLAQVYVAKKEFDTARFYALCSKAIFEETGNSIQGRDTESLLKEIDDQLLLI